MEVNFENKESTNSFYKKIKKLKKIDILINNAGINKISSIQNLDEKSLKKILNVNLLTPILLTKIVSQKMIKRKSGSIINIGSIFGHISKSQRSSYSATKAGLEGFTKAAALDLGKYGIRVNTLAPTKTIVNETELTLTKKRLDIIKSKIPSNEFTKKEDIAELCYFLTTESCQNITGSSIKIDGGWTAGK